jgi:hypothetical protein
MNQASKIYDGKDQYEKHGQDEAEFDQSGPLIVSE